MNPTERSTPYGITLLRISLGVMWMKDRPPIKITVKYVVMT